MEEILHKNIYGEQDLHRLSPDYKNINLPLRMELRRASVSTAFHPVHQHLKLCTVKTKQGQSIIRQCFKCVQISSIQCPLNTGYTRPPYIKVTLLVNFQVKHTHNHGSKLKSNSWQRNPIKKKKDTYKINKEIVQIRNSFRNIDLRNRVMLKCVDSQKSEALACGGKLLINDNETEDEANIYIHEFTENLNNLVISSHSDFKINTKPKTCKIRSENRNNRKIENTRPLNRESSNCDVISEDVLRIECKYFNNSPQLDIKEDIEVDIKKDPNENNIRTPQNNCNIPEPDLQTLLIMMALSSKTDNSVILDHDIVSHSNDHVQNHIAGEHTEKSYVTNSLKYEGITNFLNITPLRIDVIDRKKVLLKKYVERWRICVNKRKENTNNILRQRQVTLNTFFDKLAKKKLNIDQSTEPVDKAKLLVRDCSTYQHRYKVQKHIIAFQKAKLEEQNRLIEELKYKKIVEASRQSVDAMREEVRKTYYEIDRQLKPKIKCLTNELKIHEIEEPSLILHCLKVPQFLQRMEKRAREREEKHAVIRERRRQMEEERIRLKQQTELAKAEMDKEEKMKILKELREKRKKEKIESIRRKQYAERMRALTVMADLHYEKTLMMKYGLRSFKQLMNIKRDNIEKAKMHYTFQLKKNIFLHWMWFTEDMWFERNYKAEDFYRKKILRKTFLGLKEDHYQFVLKKQVAEDYYDLYVTQIAFRKLLEAVEILKREHQVKWQKVIEYHSRTLPALNALKREQEARKARWREKVLQVVPDYTPPDD